MHRPKELNLPDYMPCENWEYKADITRDNFNQLVDEYNNLVEVVNVLCALTGLIFEEDK